MKSTKRIVQEGDSTVTCIMYLCLWFHYSQTLTTSFIFNVS